MSKRDSPKEGLNIVHKIVPIAVEEEEVEMSDNKDYMKKALDSNINFIKRAISMEECRISKYVNRIHAILMIDDENGPYNRESISKVEFCEAEAGLRESFRRVEDLHWSLNIQLSSRAEDEDYYYAEDGPCILPVQNKYCEGLKAIKKYNPGL